MITNEIALERYVTSIQENKEAKPSQAKLNRVIVL